MKARNLNVRNREHLTNLFFIKYLTHQVRTSSAVDCDDKLDESRLTEH